MDVPLVRIVVNSDQCKVNVKLDLIYLLPLDGTTLPLMFDFSNCLPI